MSANAGTVFILSNDAMPGYARIEYEAKDDIANRIKQFNSAPLPVPFRLFFAAKVTNMKLVKRNLEYLFAEHQDCSDAAFYTANPDELRAAIEMAAIETVELSDEEQGISGSARAKMNQLRARHEDVYSKAQLPPAGALLYFSKSRSITCQSVGNGMVSFDGATVTPGVAAARALKKLGFNWASAHGAGYWIPLGTRSGQASNAATDPASSDDAVMPDMPFVMEDADASPVMFIRNKK